MTRGKPSALLVGPMRPLVAGGAYDPAFHTFEVLRPARLGVSYDDPHRAVLVPMDYDQTQTRDDRRARPRVGARAHGPDRVVRDDARRVRAVVVKRPRSRGRT